MQRYPPRVKWLSKPNLPTALQKLLHHFRPEYGQALLCLGGGGASGPKEPNQAVPYSHTNEITLLSDHKNTHLSWGCGSMGREFA